MLRVAGSAIGLWIQGRVPIHEEDVLVVAMVQLELDGPSTVRLARHRVRFVVPLVKIACNRDLMGLGRKAGEVHRLRHFLGGIPVGGNSPFNM